MELGSGRRSGDLGIEEGTALCDFGSALHHEPPPICRRHPGVAPGRPYVRLANVERPFGHKLAPPRAILREGGPFGEGERGADGVRAIYSLIVNGSSPVFAQLVAFIKQANVATANTPIPKDCPWVLSAIQPYCLSACLNYS